MHVKVRLILCLAVFLASVPAFSQNLSLNPSAPVDLGEDVFVQEVAPGVWLHRSTSLLGAFGRVESNGVLVAGRREAVLIDTPATVPQTVRILDWASGRLHRPVRHAIFTHAHADRIGGIDAVLERRIRTYALSRTIESARRQHIALPETALPEDGRFRRGGVELELFYPGAGHTSDNLVVWVPKERVLFGGCFVKAANSATLGNTAEADAQSWERGAAEVLRRYRAAKIVIPGHGAIGGPELVERTLHLVQARLKK